MAHEDLEDGIFGSFDGMVGVFCVVAAIATTVSAHAILKVILAGAISAAVSMGFGDFLGTWKLHRAGVMAAATALGAGLPIIPALIAHRGAGVLYGIAAEALVLGVVIATVRSRERGWIAWPLVLVCLGTAVSLTLGLTALVPGSAG